MIKSNGGIIGPDNVTTGGPFGSGSGVFKLGEVTDLIKDSKWPTVGPASYQVANSCRFNDASDDNLTRTFSAQTTRTKHSISFWCKRATLGHTQFLFEGTGGTYPTQIYFSSGDNLALYDTGENASYVTNAKFRDSSAWMHILCRIDTTQASNENRVRFYVNGVLSTTSQTNAISQGSAVSIGKGGTHTIGKRGGASDSFDGYLCEFIYIYNVSHEPTDFGEFDSNSGIWKPLSGLADSLTFNNNGFYLDFKDSSALGNDISGNNNDWTANNLTSLDQSTDTCSTNFATWNNLLGIQIPDTFSEGNLVLTMGQNAWRSTFSTIAASSGKFYAEVKWVTGSEFTAGFGNAQSYSIDQDLNDLVANPGGDGYVSVIYKNGTLYENGSNTGTGYSTYSSGNIIMLAMDLDNYKLYLGVNGTWGKSGDPANNSNGVAIPSANQGDFFNFAVSTYGTTQASGNFGSPQFAISSGNTDQNGFGNFEYAVPTGFLSLNTKNLAAVLA